MKSLRRRIVERIAFSREIREAVAKQEATERAQVDEYTDQLLTKRSELNQQVARGQITLDEAEAALGRWHEEHAPDA